jgi:hypothetical protein
MHVCILINYIFIFIYRGFRKKLSKMSIAKLIDISKNANVSPEFQNDFSKMMKIFHEVGSDVKPFPKGKMENMIEQLIELIKKDEVIPLELNPVGPQIKEMLDNCERIDLRSLEQILNMRKDPQYKKYSNLLDFMGLSLFAMYGGSESFAMYGGSGSFAAIPLNAIIVLSWHIFSIFTGILAGSVTWKYLKKNGVHTALAGFATYLVGIITSVTIATTSEAVHSKVTKVTEMGPSKYPYRSNIFGGVLLLEDPYLTFKIGMLMFLAVFIVVLLVLIYQYVYKYSILKR